MTDFQAALGLSQLKKLQAFIRKRRKIASLYSRRFSDLGVTIPSNHSHKKSVFYRYVIMVDEPDKVRNEARNKGVICEKPVWKPVHQQLRSVRCPNTDYVCDHALSIPIYPSLNEEEIEHVAATLEKALGKQQESNGPS
jgi:perosamine synthetase